MTGNGQLRWAVDNVAMATDPPCAPIMATLKTNATWLQVREGGGAVT